MKTKMMAVYFDSNRNAMGDFYKNLVNHFACKENVIVVIPSAYDVEEFEDDFLLKIREDVSCQGNKFKRLFKLYDFVRKINGIVLKYNITRLYFQVDQFVYDYFLLFSNGNLRTTVWVHDVMVHDGEGVSAKIKKKLTKNLLFPRIERFVVSYKKGIDEFGVKYGWKYKNKVEVIYLPRLAELEFEDLKNTDFDIVYDYIFYGRIERYKGLDLLLEAMNDVSMKNIKLLIVGRGREDIIIKKKVDSMSNVEFINSYVSNRDLAKYIKKSRCVILPYRSATGTQTIQVANYYGKIVLATRVGCFPEYIKDGVNGRFIKEFSKTAIVEAMLKQQSDRNEYCIDEQFNIFDLNNTVEKLQRAVSG